MGISRWLFGEVGTAFRPWKNSLGMKFVRILPGEFMMGSLGSDRHALAIERPRHRVRITRPFYLGMFQVTQEQYEQVVGHNPSHFTARVTLPVQMVSWEDAQEFCRMLSSLAEEKSVGHVYRLPTEAEWEYACRAGTNTLYSFGNDPSKLGKYCWWDANTGLGPRPVGRKRPNPWGLYDMHGNVWEWCYDWFDDDYYASSPKEDPSGPSSGQVRVVRGCAWNNFGYPGMFRCAYRHGHDPHLCRGDTGFRVAVGLKPDEEISVDRERSVRAVAVKGSQFPQEEKGAETVRATDEKVVKHGFEHASLTQELTDDEIINLLGQAKPAASTMTGLPPRSKPSPTRILREDGVFGWEHRKAGQWFAAREFPRPKRGKPDEAQWFWDMASNAFQKGSWREAWACFHLCFGLFCEQDNLYESARCLRRLGTTYKRLGLNELSRTCLAESLEINRALGDEKAIAVLLYELGEAHLLCKEAIAAEPVLREAVVRLSGVDEEACESARLMLKSIRQAGSCGNEERLDRITQPKHGIAHATAGAYLFDWSRILAGEYGHYVFERIVRTLSPIKASAIFWHGDIGAVNAKEVAQGVRKHGGLLVQASSLEAATPLVDANTEFPESVFLVGIWMEQSDTLDLLHNAFDRERTEGYLGYIAPPEGLFNPESWNHLMRKQLHLVQDKKMRQGELEGSF